jgi:hypothetical protein
MKSQSDDWQDLPFDSDALKIIQHHLERVGICDETERFSNRDLTHALLLHLLDQGDMSLFPGTFGDAIQQLSENDEVPETVVGDYLEGIQPHVRELVEDGLRLVLGRYHGKGPATWGGMSESVLEWQKFTLSNTLGKVMIEAASIFTGAREEAIDFNINIDDNTITLFDDDSEGNGCCQAIWIHYHISAASRAANGQMRAPPLPTEDFTDLIEGQMMTCPEHIANRLAIDIHLERETPKRLLRATRQAEAHVKSHSKIWDVLEINSLRQVELLSNLSSVLRNRSFPELSVDEIDQALHVCSTGCFVCEGAPRASAIPLSIAARYTSRALLDSLTGLNPDSEGYADSRADHNLGASAERDPEVFPHWYRDNDQEIVIPHTIIPRQVGLWVRRDGEQQTPEPIRLVRLLDNLSEVV